MITEYSIEKHKHGILIFKPLPVDDVIEIFKCYEKLFDYDLCDGLIAQHFRASFCLTSKKLSEIWRKELNIYNDKIGDFSKDIW